MRSGSSVRERLRPPTKRLTRKHSVRHVKFSAEEMAYDPEPSETEDWLPIGRGVSAYEKFRRWRKQMVRLDADVARVFTDSVAVNNALRKLIQAMPDRSSRP